jgi:hypothetical protein
MSELTDEVCDLIERATEEERRVILSYLRERVPLHSLEAQWNTTAEEILTAIARSSDLTLRGIRGILAEAIFEKRILPCLQLDHWQTLKIVGDQPYDFLIERGTVKIKIQVKLQRRQEGQTKTYSAKSRGKLPHPPAGPLYVVEVQKTRTGKKNGEDTRPYRFGDFDILAVNLQPATGSWDRFVYTVGGWLLPRQADPTKIEIMQPVPVTPDEYWTDNLRTCIGCLLQAPQKRLYS